MQRRDLEKIRDEIEQLPVWDQLNMVSSMLQAGRFKVANGILKKVAGEFSMAIDHVRIVTNGVMKTYAIVKKNGLEIQ